MSRKKIAATFASAALLLPTVTHATSTCEEHLEKIARFHHLDPKIARGLVHVESRNNPNARSSKHAIGCAQVRKITQKDLLHGSTQHYAKRKGIQHIIQGNLYDPETNLHTGFAYLAALLEKFQDLDLALTAYSHGPTTVQNLLTTRGHLPKSYNEYAQKVRDASKHKPVPSFAYVESDGSSHVLEARVAFDSSVREILERFDWWNKEKKSPYHPLHFDDVYKADQKIYVSATPRTRAARNLYKN